MKKLVRRFLNFFKLLCCLLNNPKKNDDLVIVTGADSTHYQSLKQLLESINSIEPKIRIIVFDLGLRVSESQFIVKNFHLEEFRKFDYSKYPEYFNIKVAAGQYAWKPVIFSKIFEEYKGCVCWMDAGNIIKKKLFWIRRITSKIGIYTGYSPGCIADWTHPKTLGYLKVTDKLLKMPNLDAACICACYDNNTVRDIIKKWKEGALDRDCIAPKGSSRVNHRQDQAVFSVLAHRAGITKYMPNGRYGYNIHQDID